MRDVKPRKVTIVGAGDVGATFAYALTMSGLVQEIGLINRNHAKAEGEAMDLNHCLPFVSPVTITAGGYEQCADAQVVVITAGAAQEEGESRLDLGAKNARIMSKIVRQVLEHNTNPILLITSNPVDVMTHVALKESGMDPNRVLGTGTVLDTARFRYLLSARCGLDPRNVHAYIVGEHGDTTVPLWSRVNMAGVSMDYFCKDCNRECPATVKDDILSDVRDAAYKIIEKKGSTYYAVGLAQVRIVEAILKDQHSVLTVSSLVNDCYNLGEVCLSLPCVISAQGREEIVRAPISESEEAALAHSAEVLRKATAHAEEKM